jgi:hypothetical protein
MIPTIIRIQPIVWMFTPETVFDTANARIAPTAVRKMPTPRPMWCVSLLRCSRAERGVLSPNGEALFPVAGHAWARESVSIGSGADA